MLKGSARENYQIKGLVHAELDRFKGYVCFLVDIHGAKADPRLKEQIQHISQVHFDKII